MKKPTVQIFSVFGQIEAVAADILIDAGKAARIHRKMIPKGVLKNKDGTPARFAVSIPREHVAEFEQLIADLRA